MAVEMALVRGAFEGLRKIVVPGEEEPAATCRAGLQAAEDWGRRGGRQAVVTSEKLAKARQHLAAGLNVREAAARVKIGKTALYEALKAEKSAASTVKPA
nr:hypothetical protein [Mesorhizobium sp.]